MSDERRREQQARPGYHDPLAGFDGAAPSRSALTLRLVLAGIGLVCFGASAIVGWLAGLPAWFVACCAVLAAIAAADIVVVARRKARGEPG